MASTHTLNSHSYDGRYLQVSLTQTADAANRRSKITGTVTSLAGSATWYATGPTTINIAGTQRYTRARESNGTGQSNRNFVGTIGEFYVSHDSSGNASVGVEIITAIYASATQTSSNTWTLDSISPATTACGAPTSLSVNSTLSEGNVTLSWSGATAGTANSISDYEVQYSESSDNSSWGSWYAYSTTSATSLSVSPSGTRGYYRRFQVRTRGSAGSSYYSGWKVSTNSVRKATLPTAPTACSVNTTLSENNVTLSWSGAASGSGHTIASYEIQYSESSDNASWGSWYSLTTVTTTATSGSVSVSPSGTRGYYRRFQVRAVSSSGSGYYSPWKISTNSVRRNTMPGMPTSVTASPSVYSNEDITITWSGTSAGTSAIKGYRLSYSSATTDGTVGTVWYTIATIDLASSSGSYTWNGITRTPGNYTTISVTAIDALDVMSDRKIGTTLYCNITACGAPTSCSVSAALSEGAVTLSWSGASSGAGNAITGYEIQYSESPDNATWTSWYAYSSYSTTVTSGSLSVTPSANRGAYRRFQIRTLGAAGSSYYSAWKVTTNSVRKNTLPTPPATFTALPAIYAGSTVSLSWSGAAAGTSAIKQYVIQQCTSTDNATWNAYSTLVTISSSATSGSYAAAASSVAGTYTRYRISVTDTLDAVSGYTVSGSVKRNSPPGVPTVAAPVNGSSTYNTKPRFLIRTGTEPDNQSQIAAVKIGAGVWQTSVSNSPMYSVGGNLPADYPVIFRADTQTAGAKTAAIRCLDSGIEAPSAEVSRSFTVLPSPFEPLTPNQTHVKAAHIQTMRTAVNTVRGYYGFAAVSWNEEVTAGKTSIKNWPFHISEIRRAIEPVVSYINNFTAFTTFDVPNPVWLSLGTGRPRMEVMAQIHNLLLSL
jgi:hypothetical protein